MTESLDKNVFYRTLFTTFHDLFSEASKNCWIICVPPNKKIKGVKIDASFIKAHLMKPSPFLKDHYIPINGSYVKDIEIKENTFVVKRETDTSLVKILAAEDAYNEKNDLHRILLIDRPLTSRHLSSSFEDEDTTKKEISTFVECKSYLDSLSSQTLKDVEENASKLRVTIKDDLDINQVLEVFAPVINWSTERFLMECHYDDDLDHALLEIAIESVILYPYHDKIFKVVCSEWQESAEEVAVKASHMKSLKLDMSSLGTEADLDSFVSRSEVTDQLDSLTQCKTPLEKMVTFKNVLNSIRLDLLQYLESAHSPFDDNPVKTLTADDLVAATIFTLLHVKDIKNVFYSFKFVQSLGTRLPAMNEMAYSLVTFEVALGFIQNYAMAKREENRKQSGKSIAFDNYSKDTSRVSSVSSSWSTDSNDSSSDARRRSKSFRSIRTRDPRYDKQLDELSRMIDELSTDPPTSTDDQQGNRATSSITTSQATPTSNQDLGDFLNSLHTNSRFGYTYGKLNN